MPIILGNAMCGGGTVGVWLVLLRVLESSWLCCPIVEVGLF